LMRDTNSCALRLYVYPGFPPLQMRHALGPGAHGLPFQISTFSTPANRRAFTSEIPILLRLLSSCRLVGPAAADLYVVPAPIGTAIVSRWSTVSGYRSQQNDDVLHLLDPTHINRTLPYLSAATAERHIFFCTVDSQFVYLGAHGQTGRLLGLDRAIWVHLGDDSSTGLPHRPGRATTARSTATGARAGGGVLIENGLTVPYRISHWLPFGFPPPPKPKRLLLFGTLNGAKHPAVRPPRAPRDSNHTHTAH
jgi:hypothetical protein